MKNWAWGGYKSSCMSQQNVESTWPYGNYLWEIWMFGEITNWYFDFVHLAGCFSLAVETH